MVLEKYLQEKALETSLIYRIGLSSMVKGEIFYEIKNNEKALLSFKEAIQNFEFYYSKTVSMQPVRHIAYCSTKIGEITKSAVLFEKVLEYYNFIRHIDGTLTVWEFREYAWCQMKVGEILRDVSKIKTAAEFFEYALTYEENDWTIKALVDCYNKIGILDFNLKSLENVINNLRKLLIYNRETILIQRAISYCYLYKSLIELNEDSYVSVINEIDKIPEKEIDILLHSMKLSCRTELAKMYDDKEEFEKLIIEFKILSKFKVSKFNTGVNLFEHSNSMYYELQSLSESEQSLIPFFLAGYGITEIVIINKSLKQFSIAMSFFKKSLKIAYKPFIIDTIGNSYLCLEQPEESKKWLIRGIELDENRAAYYISLGHCELVLGNKNVAIDNYKKSLNLFNYSEVFFKDFEEDFEHIELQGVSKEDYEVIKQELRRYCESKKEQG